MQVSYLSPKLKVNGTLSSGDFQLLRERAYATRKQILRMAAKGGCFVGAAFSCVDLLVYLYTRFLKISKEHLTDPERDYLFLSKGHAVSALYGLFAEMGWIDPHRLENHLNPYDHVYWHPHPRIPGVEFHSGSLGHLLPIGVGVALDCKLTKGRNRIVVILGDGELNEGSNWEACLIAHAYRLDNLILIIDRNGFQANLRTEQLLPLEPLEEKFKAFGLSEMTIDGHSFFEMENVFPYLPFDMGLPNVIIAETVRGKGLKRFESRSDAWFCHLTEDEVNRLITEIER